MIVRLELSAEEEKRAKLPIGTLVSGSSVMDSDFISCGDEVGSDNIVQVTVNAGVQNAGNVAFNKHQLFNQMEG